MPTPIDRIVVTGAFGYVGLALLPRLVARAPVVGIGHPPRAHVPVPQGVEVVHGDLVLAAERLGPRVALVHLAGGGGEAVCRRDPVAAARTIVHGTSVLAAAMRERGAARSLMASTIAVYGTARGGVQREADGVAPDDLYGTLKAAAEHVFTVHGGGTALRLANVYGPGCGTDLGLAGAVERFARAAAAGQDVTVYGDGRQRIDYVHADDLGDAVLRALDAPVLPPALNVGGGSPVAVGDLAELCVRAAAALDVRSRVVHVSAPPGKVWPDRSLSNELAASTLGWAPRVPLADGVAQVVAMMAKAPAA